MKPQPLIFGFVATGLLAVVALELAQPLSPAPAPQELGETPPSTDLPGGERGGAAAAVAQILARPLFRPGRAPAPADRPAAENIADLPRLTGILISPEGSRAIFQQASGGRPTVTEEGDTIGRWRVEQIAAGAVTVSGPEGSVRLTPKFDGRATAPDPINAPAARPAPQRPAPNFASQAQPGMAGAAAKQRPARGGPSPDGSINGGASGNGNP